MQIHCIIDSVSLNMIEYENDVVYLRWVEDDIWTGGYKVLKVDEDVAREALRFRKESLAGQNIKFLADVTQVKSVSKQARDFLGSVEAHEGIAASALITSSPLTVMLVNFYLRFSSQPAPTRLVKNMEEGLKWLRSVEIKK